MIIDYDFGLIDSVSISAHKVGGFKGIGALYQKVPKLSHPLILGGLQENGTRAGTENLPGIISFGIKAQEIKEDNPWAQVEILKSNDHMPWAGHSARYAVKDIYNHIQSANISIVFVCIIIDLV